MDSLLWVFSIGANSKNYREQPEISFHFSDSCGGKTSPKPPVFQKHLSHLEQTLVNPNRTARTVFTQQQRWKNGMFNIPLYLQQQAHQWIFQNCFFVNIHEMLVAMWNKILFQWVAHFSHTTEKTALFFSNRQTHAIVFYIQSVLPNAKLRNPYIQIALSKFHYHFRIYLFVVTGPKSFTGLPFCKY